MTSEVDLDDVSVAYRIRGPSGAPPLVWAHGLSSSMSSEDDLPLVDWSIAAPGHRVVRYDARGHGDTRSDGEPSDHTWDRLARDQLALADALGIERYVAAGASMGCATAIHAALAAPARIDALVLVIPPTAWTTREEQTAMYTSMADLLDAGRLDVLVRGVDVAPLPDPFVDDPRWKERSRRALLESDPSRLACVFRGAALTDLPDPDELSTIEQPTLLLSWSGDPGHPVSTADRLAALLPNATAHVASTAADLASWSDRIATFLVDR